jgi:hypothetical protein
MLQVFYLDVAYVTWAIHVYCKCMFQMFQLFQMYVANILSGCCICCSGHTHMLQVYVCKCFIFLSDVCCSKCFMLQVLHDQTREVGVDRSVAYVAGSEAGAVAPICMCKSMCTATTGVVRSAGAVAAARGQVRWQQCAGEHTGVACMCCGTCPGKVGGGGTVHTSLPLAVCASREVRRLHLFLPHAKGVHQARGRAVNASLSEKNIEIG